MSHTGEFPTININFHFRCTFWGIKLILSSEIKMKAISWLPSSLSWLFQLQWFLKWMDSQIINWRKERLFYFFFFRIYKPSWNSIKNINIYRKVATRKTVCLNIIYDSRYEQSCSSCCIVSGVPSLFRCHLFSVLPVRPFRYFLNNFLLILFTLVCQWLSSF